MEREGWFYSGGCRLAASLYAPEGGSGRCPAVVLCNGFRANKAVFLPAFARAFNAHGWAALSVDYRGFGASEGVRGRLISRERAEDISAAITFLSLQPEADPERIALLGLSYGAATAISAAACDLRARAVVGVGSLADPEEWLRAGRDEAEWGAFLAQVEAARDKRVLTGQCEYVDSRAFFSPKAPRPDPELERRIPRREIEAQLKAAFPWETAEDMLRYKPLEEVARLAPRPLILVTGEKDTFWPQARRLYQQAREPKHWVTLAGHGHTDCFLPELGLPKVMEAVMPLLQRYVG